MVAEGPFTLTLSITSGYRVPCARNSAPSMREASSSNTFTNSSPIIFLFFSGSVTFSSLLRNLSPASTCTRLSLISMMDSTTSSSSLFLRSPVSTKMQ